VNRTFSKKYIHGSCPERIRRWQFLIFNVRSMKNKNVEKLIKTWGSQRNSIATGLRTAVKNWT